MSLVTGLARLPVARAASVPSVNVIQQQIGRAYSGACPGAVISVTAISTFNGLNALSNAGSKPWSG